MPESAAHAKQQAAAARQAEEAAPLSNVRGEPGYSSSALASQTPSRDMKMPPLGHFNVKDSAKDNKKRRSGPGAPSALGSSVSASAAATEAVRVADSQGVRVTSLQNGNANKVSQFQFNNSCHFQPRFKRQLSRGLFRLSKGIALDN